MWRQPTWTRSSDAKSNNPFKKLSRITSTEMSWTSALGKKPLPITSRRINDQHKIEYRYWLYKFNVRLVKLKVNECYFLKLEMESAFHSTIIHDYLHSHLSACFSKIYFLIFLNSKNHVWFYPNWMSKCFNPNHATIVIKMTSINEIRRYLPT